MDVPQKAKSTDLSLTWLFRASNPNRSAWTSGLAPEYTSLAPVLRSRADSLSSFNSQCQSRNPLSSSSLCAKRRPAWYTAAHTAALETFRRRRPNMGPPQMYQAELQCVASHTSHQRRVRRAGTATDVESARHNSRSKARNIAPTGCQPEGSGIGPAILAQAQAVSQRRMMKVR